MTAKQSAFVGENLIDLNASQAGIRAGYRPKTAYSIGQENLKSQQQLKARSLGARNAPK